MKGLLIKDLKLMANQRQFLLMLLVFTVLFMNTNVDFVIGYLTFVGSFFTLSTISYDEYDNGYAFLFTLPVDRKRYVKEKYLLFMGLSIFTGILSFVLVYGYRSMVQGNGRSQDLLFTVGSVLLAVCFMMALLLPLQLKFGSEKNRIALVMVVGGGTLIGYGIMKLLGYFSIDIEALFLQIAESPSLIPVVLAAVIGIVLFFSYKISVKIMEGKEF